MTPVKVGDVMFLHPFMLHLASWNRFEGGEDSYESAVEFKGADAFDREDRKYSLVKRKTLIELGKERLGV
jgi:hypothetical protein